MSHGNADAVIGGISLDGSTTVLKAAGRLGRDNGLEIAAKGDYLYAVFAAEKGFIFDSTDIFNPKNREQLIFVRLDSQLNLVWQQTLYYDYYGYDASLDFDGMEVDENGNLFFWGPMFANTIWCGNKFVTNQSHPSQHFIAYGKINSEGICKNLYKSNESWKSFSELLILDKNRLFVLGNGHIGSFIQEADSNFSFMNHEAIGASTGSIATKAAQMQNNKLAIMGRTDQGIFKLDDLEADYWTASGSVYIAIRSSTEIKQDTNAVYIPEKEHRLFRAFPNPSNGIIVLSGLDSPLPAKLRVKDELGREVYSLLEVDQKADLSHLTNGVYILEFEQGHQTYYSKLIIRH